MSLESIKISRRSSVYSYMMVLGPRPHTDYKHFLLLLEVLQYLVMLIIYYMKSIIDYTIRFSSLSSTCSNWKKNWVLQSEIADRMATKGQPPLLKKRTSRSHSEVEVAREGQRACAGRWTVWLTGRTLQCHVAPHCEYTPRSCLRLIQLRELWPWSMKSHKQSQASFSVTMNKCSRGLQVVTFYFELITAASARVFAVTVKRRARNMRRPGSGLRLVRPSHNSSKQHTRFPWNKQGCRNHTISKVLSSGITFCGHQQNAKWEEQRQPVVLYICQLRCLSCPLTCLLIAEPPSKWSKKRGRTTSRTSRHPLDWKNLLPDLFRQYPECTRKCSLPVCWPQPAGSTIQPILKSSSRQHTSVTVRTTAFWEGHHSSVVLVSRVHVKQSYYHWAWCFPARRTQ